MSSGIEVNGSDMVRKKEKKWSGRKRKMGSGEDGGAKETLQREKNEHVRMR